MNDADIILPTTGSGGGMSLLPPDVPFGLPAFALSDDQIATAVNLVRRGCDAARPDVTRGMLEY